MKTKPKRIRAAKAAPIQPDPPAATAAKCQAHAVGHRRCQCGGPDCGENCATD